MDTAIWATWYDLDPEDEEAHLAWLHGTYLPSLRARSGILWVAHYKNVGGGAAMDVLHNRLKRSEDEVSHGGSTYIIIAGAASALTFFKPSMLDIETAATGETRMRLDQRRAPQQFIFTEYARVNGPEWGRRAPGTVPGRGIQFGAIRSNSLEGEHYAGKWYSEFRLPAMTTMPGCITARIFLCNYGWPKFGVLYEFTSLDARQEAFEAHETRGDREAPSQWVGRLGNYVVHVAGSPAVAERKWPLEPDPA